MGFQVNYLLNLIVEEPALVKAAMPALLQTRARLCLRTSEMVMSRPMLRSATGRKPQVATNPY